MSSAAARLCFAKHLINIQMGLFDMFKKNPENSGTSTQAVSGYSAVDSNQKAQELFAKGKLVKMYLMPLAFGGEDSPMNTLFVPEFANNKKNSFDSKLRGMIQSGLELEYSASPEYKGSSFIPGKLVINVTGDRTITEVIDIW